MPNNELNHDRTLSNLNTEAKYAKHTRRWSRYGRNGENVGSRAFRDVRRAYNRAYRKASRVQLSRYQAQSEEDTQPEIDIEYYAWEDLRTQEDEWYQRKLDERYNWDAAYNRLAGRFPY